MTFLTELKRLKDAATRGGWEGCEAKNELGERLYRHADEIAALVEAAWKLNNSVKGLAAFEREVREAAGNTNYAVLMQKSEKFTEALAALNKESPCPKK